MRIRVAHGLAVVTVALAAACGAGSTAASGSTPTAVATADAANASFTIEGRPVTLANGRAETDGPSGSATKVVTTLTDKRATGDVDGDGRPDTVVVLTQERGGTGVFFYVTAILNGASGPTTTPAVLLGDRIALSGVRLDGATIVVELLDRASGQPFTTTPSVQVVKRFGVVQGTLQAR